MSLFRANKPKVTLLFKEILGEIVEQQPDLMIGLAVELAAERSGLPCGDIETLVERLVQETPPPATTKPPGPKAKGFGAKYMSWLETLKSDQLCLWLADYDVGHANDLYCDTEIDLVKAMIELKTAHTWQDLRARFEACLMGFGGELKDQGVNLHEVDMTDGQAVNSMVEMMKKLGF